MRILKIIHGYPPLYNTSSEVYSQMLRHGLAKNHEVHVITREENPFTEYFSLNVTQDNMQLSITLYNRVKPDLVHIGHLNHLSISLVEVISKNNIPIFLYSS